MIEPIDQVLTDKIRNRTAHIGIIGLGYVGLPLALTFARNGFTVTGFDVNESYCEALRQGHSAIIDVSDGELSRSVTAGRFRPTSNPAQLRDVDAYLICVPTPLSKTRQPDLGYVLQAIDTLVTNWRPGTLVVLESTTYPGTTDEVLLAALEQGGAQLDHDFLLAFSPERVDPGNKKHPLHTIPKVVGGVSPASSEVACELYGTVFERVHPVSSARAAELTKLLENTFRNVNIALANEFAQICDALDVDIWEVIEAAKTKPFGFMAFHPGPGIGGHCIPLDPQYLVYKARLSGYEPRLVALADQINQEMPKYVVRKAMTTLNRHRKALNGARVLVVGVAYKPNVPDTRESPALSVIEELLEHGAEVSYFDPFVSTLTLENGHTLSGGALTPAAIEAADLIIITTDHDVPEMALLREALDNPEAARQLADKLLDTRNALRRHGARQPLSSSA